MIQIKSMTHDHTQAVVAMMRTFYHSAAVYTNGSEEIYRRDVEACLGENPFLEGFVFTEDDTVLGYAMIAKSFSTEFGRHCVWIEDLYLKPEYRGMGIGSRLFSFLEEMFPGTLLRLEVEAENDQAVRMYRRNGFDVLPYMEMKKILNDPIEDC